MDREQILEQMRALRAQDVRWEENRAFSLVFHHSDEHAEFLKQAHYLFCEGNGLNPMAFASLRTFEHDVVRMAANLFHGGRQAVGTMTSGGTESILLAVRTYRDRARQLQPRIKRPEMVVPETVHVAFDKAGKYFDVKMVHAPLDRSMRVDVRAVRRLINANTIALVGSAPNYPNGMIDPIEKLAALAVERGLGMHVDACIGGFFLPWAERLGHPIPTFDFRVPGVTSISADLHKYGYAAKGASTILYRSMDYLRHQFFVYVDWPGGVFASPSLPGTRPGGVIAAAWATLLAMGEDGYLRNAETVLRVTRQFIDGINAIEGLRVLGDPPVGVFAYTATDPALSLYAIADQMSAKGWHIDRQQKPASIHLMINPGHAEIVDTYLADLREAVEYVRAHPEAAASGSAPAYGLIANAPLRGLVASNVLAMMERLYSAEGQLPALEAGAEGGPAASLPKPVQWLMKLKDRFGHRS
jgi:glutamate/tyrosine decarboxylase-like PLP-dependent enzyme